MADACVTFSDLTLGYSSHAAVHHLSGALAAGSLTAIIGANGSGKSTLLKGIAGILSPLSGGCIVSQGRRVAFLAQRSEIDLHFPAQVRDLVSLGLWQRRGLFGRVTAEDKARVEAAISTVGLAGFEDRDLNTLSGGQFQRALFARVIVQDADLILLDEPFNHVDAKTVADLLGLIRNWHGEGRTVVVVAHDLELVRAAFPETLLLARRPIAWGPTSEVLTEANLRAASHFSEAWRDDAPWCEPEAGHDDHEHDDHHEHGHEHHHHGHRHGAVA